MSDVVNKYKETSDEQRVSNIIQGNVEVCKLSEAAVEAPKVKTLEEKCKLDRLVLKKNQSENEKKVEVEGVACGNVSQIINAAMESVGNRKAKVKTELKLFD